MFALAPHHDLESLAERYQLRRRIQIRDFLTEDAALEIHQLLANETPWGLCFNQGERVAALRAADLAGLSGDEKAQIGQMVASGARDGYQFIYQHFPLFSDYFDPAQPAMPLFRAFEFINSAPFLDFVRGLTGHDDLVWADAQATCYRAGDFLMRHTDEVPKTRRRAAYVLNFTPDWRPDWGGYLQFFDDKFDIEQGFRPLFNAMNIFSVPQDHSVGAVSNFAPIPRLSLTGWFRADQPPRPIGDRAAFGAERA